jgi:hypothetical protein
VGVENGIKHFKSGFPLVGVPSSGDLRDVLNGERFIEVLPLLHFLHELVGAGRSDGPPLRACFMFDDPNLHWRRYGYVDFEQIAARAVKHNYHVSFATIPIDSWFIHKPTAALFRDNPEHLSLTVHGNNHTKRELAVDYTEGQRAFLLRQAVRRIQRLERNAGLRVCRVMVPPHGACTQAMLAQLRRYGFEAACISHGSLRAHNKSRDWTRTLGYSPSEVVEGCSVLPRWGLRGNITNTILLAMYLKQPIVLRGHQEDLKDGPDLLDQVARFINNVGPVSWSNMTGISRANYTWRLEGDLMTVRPFGPKLTIHCPKGILRLMVQSPPQNIWETWQLSGDDGTMLSIHSGECVSLCKPFGGALCLAAANPPPIPEEKCPNHLAAVAFLRRLATEGRDRLLS